MKLGYKLFSEGCGPKELVRQAVARRGGRVRLRRDQRPLPPLAVRPRPLAVRVVGAGRDRRAAPSASSWRRASPARRSATTRRSSRRRRRPSRCSRTGASRSGSAPASSSTSTSSAAAGPRSPSATRSFARRSRSSACSGRAAISPMRASTCSSRTRACSTSPRRRHRSSSRSAARGRRRSRPSTATGSSPPTPSRKLVERLRDAGGSGAMYTEVPLAWAPDEDSAARSAHAHVSLRAPELEGPRRAPEPDQLRGGVRVHHRRRRARGLRLRARRRAPCRGRAPVRRAPASTTSR